MAILAVVVVGVLAFVIAAFVIGREARRLGSQPLQPVYRMTEALSSVADDLPEEVASTLTTVDLETITRIHLNILQFDTGAETGTDADDVVVDGDQTAERVYRQARGDGLDVALPDVEAAVAAHVRYLSAIGALGAVESP